MEAGKLQRQDSALFRMEAASGCTRTREDIERDNAALQDGKQGREKSDSPHHTKDLNDVLVTCAPH